MTPPLGVPRSNAVPDPHTVPIHDPRPFGDEIPLIKSYDSRGAASAGLRRAGGSRT